MDPVLIIDIVEVPDSDKCQYVLNRLGLDDILVKVGDRRVALVFGVSKQGEGNSFLMNKIGRHIMNSKKYGVAPDGDDMEIIADPTEPLFGFDWSPDTNSQTTRGIWFSQPFIVYKSSGEEVAIILVDTQGLYDDCSTERDWSTIVGLSLLMSSTLIFNVHNDLGEDTLSSMHKFLDYGLQALNNIECPDDDPFDGDGSKPFQDVIFMIRDWTRPDPPHGLEGGQNYRNAKFEIKPKQKPTAKKSRQIIVDSFENYQCFLMPSPGLEAISGDPGFNGCANRLTEEFNARVDEFCRHLLGNADAIKVKTINGRPVRGDELAQFFDECVRIFNSDEMPRASDNVEARHRAADIRLINQLKDEYVNEMAILSLDKPFSGQTQLRTQSDDLIDSMKTKFSFRKKSSDQSVIQELTALLAQTLDTAFQSRYSDNENRRLTATNDMITELVDEFKADINEHITPDDYISDYTFAKIVDTKREHIVNRFDTFCAVEPQLFDSHKQRLLNQIQSESNVFIANNNQHNHQLISTYDNCVAMLKSRYDQKMNDLYSDPAKYYDTEELEALSLSMQLDLQVTLDACDANTDVIPITPYKDSLDSYIRDKLQGLLMMNTQRRDHDISALETVMSNLVKEYEDELNAWIEDSTDIDTREEFLRQTRDISARLIAENRHNLRLDVRELKDRFQATVPDLIDIFAEHVDSRRVTEKLLADRIIQWYNQEMGREYDNTTFIIPERLEGIHRGLVDTALKKFKNQRGHITSDRYDELVRDILKTAYQTHQDDNDKNAPAVPAVGIDLGTTNSCVGYYKPGRQNAGQVVIFKNRHNSEVTPSCVEFRDNSEHPVVGQEAKDNRLANPRNIIFSAKRLIGRKYDEPEVDRDFVAPDTKLYPFQVVDVGDNDAGVEVEVDGMVAQFLPEEVSAHVLRKMKEVAEEKLGFPIQNVVITVPAYFMDAQKEATKSAGVMAGLNVLKIINEPTAAALAYQLDRFEGIEARKVLIYDFGGGTFDVAVLKLEKGKVEVCAFGGDNHLGGDNLDNNVINYCLQEFFAQTGILIDRTSAEGERALRLLRYSCEREKWLLSEAMSANISVDNIVNGQHLEVRLTREKFEELNEREFQRTIDRVDDVLNGAGMSVDDIDDIVLVGGSTHIPKVRELIKDHFKGKQPSSRVNPLQAVAEGAAIQAAILNGNQAQKHRNLRVLDVTPHAIGVKTTGDVMSSIIPARSPVCTVFTKQYKTIVDNQPEIEVEVYEGEKPVASHNNLLGKFMVTNIPPAEAGREIISVMLCVNDDGILKVRAEVLSKGTVHEIEVTEHKGRLSMEELLRRRH